MNPQGTPADEIELLQSMQARLSAFLLEKASAQKQVSAYDEELTGGFRSLGQRPKETEEEIEKMIKAKQFEQTTRSMSLNDEKKVLRAIDDLKKLKVRVKQYKSSEEELQAKRRQRNSLHDQIKVMDGTISELNQAIRKLQLAQRVGVGSDALVTITVQVPEEFMSRVIGKGGSNLKKLEELCRVSVDMNKETQTAELSGSIDGCELARQKIEEITHSITEDIPVSEAMIQSLLVQKGALIGSLMDQHNIRLDVLKSERVLRVTGLPQEVADLRATVAKIRVGSERVPIDSKLIPSVVGKGGVNFRKIEEECGVGIDIDRAEDSAAILIRGPQDQLPVAVDAIHHLIETYEDREDRVEVDRFKARLLMEDQGRLLKEVRKATNCLLHIDLKKEAEEGFIVVKSQAYKLAEGMEAVKQLLAQLEENTLLMNVDEEMVRYVIGKKGAVINKLRQDTGASIDTDMKSGLIRIYSDDEAKRNNAREEILKIVEKNQMSDVTICREAAIALKGQKGAELREKCNQMEVQLDIDSEAGMIGLRGPIEAMEQVKMLLLEFSEANYAVDMDLPTDDFITLISGGENSLRKRIQDETGAQLITIKDKEVEGDGVLKIRGPRQAVLKAEEIVRKVLDGEDDGSGALLPVHPDALPALIGKSGATINKLAEEYGVQLIVLKVRKAVRIRGEPEKVQAARDALRKYVSELRVTFTVPASRAQQDMLESRSKRELVAVTQSHDIVLENTRDAFRLRGLVTEVTSARARLTELISGRSRVAVPLLADQVTALASHGDSNWRQIREDFGVSVDLDRINNVLVVQGATAAVSRAKDHLYDMLEVLLSGQFAHVAVPVEALPFLALPSTLEQLTTSTGLDEGGVIVDRERSVVRLRGPAEAVRAGVDGVAENVQRWTECHVSLPVDAWMLPLLIGKQGANIKELEKATGVTVDIDRDREGTQGGSCKLRLSGNDAEAIKRAKATVTEQLDAIRRENLEMEIPRDVVPFLIGKKGANLNKLREDTGANIDVLTEGKEKEGQSAVNNYTPGMSLVRIRGSEECIAKTKAAIEAFVEDYQKNNMQREVPVHPDQFRLIVGRTGSTVKLIQEESGAKLDMIRDRNVVVIRGSTEAVEKGRAMVQRIIDDDNAINAASRAEADARQKKEVSAASQAAPHDSPKDAATAPMPAEWSFPKVPPGMDPAMANKLMQQKPSESKTAKKKKKKQEKAAAAAAATPVVEELSVQPPAPATPPRPTHTAKAPAAETHATAVGQGVHSPKKEIASPRAEPAPKVSVNQLVNTERAGELLSFILGAPGAPKGGAGGHGAQNGGGAYGAAGEDNGEAVKNYYKSATGLSVRL